MSTICHSTLPSPDELSKLIPISLKSSQSILEFRTTCSNILRGIDQRIVVILGPCSIHDEQTALEYGKRVKELQASVSSHVFLVMRVFFEKPRTRIGWKGLIYDPFLDGSNDLGEGLKKSRAILVALANLGVPCATEFLDPLVATYLSDLISWGLIGARTVASQPHRQLASGLGFPIGFKNGIFGEIEPALSGIAAAKMSHTHFSINGQGKISSVQTTGNPLVHLVLRGSDKKVNCDPESVEAVLSELRLHHLDERLIIDCAHGNSGKDLKRQTAAFTGCIEQIQQGCKAIRGLMLESHLFEGKQAIPEEIGQLIYGVSITDPCLGWEETADLVSSICTSLVQN